MKVYVFQIDLEIKKNWILVSKSVVSVFYYYDIIWNIYCIISVDGFKVRQQQVYNEDYIICIIYIRVLGLIFFNKDF